MGFKNLVDFHLHTDNSDDGFDPVMLMCEHAVNVGLRAVAITDHCEINRYRADIYRFDKSIRQSFIEAKKAKDAAKEKDAEAAPSAKTILGKLPKLFGK